LWYHRNTFAIGGLQNVGYAKAQDILIVLSTQGQGLFNCISGEKIARLNNDLGWLEHFDEITNSIAGFDCLKDIIIPTSGLYGTNCLARQTNDGWSLTTTKSINKFIANNSIISHSVTQIYLTTPNEEKYFLGEDGACELRAFGFSDTFKSLIVATSCELIIYSRDEN